MQAQPIAMITLEADCSAVIGDRWYIYPGRDCQLGEFAQSGIYCFIFSNIHIGITSELQSISSHFAGYPTGAHASEDTDVVISTVVHSRAVTFIKVPVRNRIVIGPDTNPHCIVHILLAVTGVKVQLVKTDLRNCDAGVFNITGLDESYRWTADLRPGVC